MTFKQHPVEDASAKETEKESTERKREIREAGGGGGWWGCLEVERAGAGAVHTAARQAFPAYETRSSLSTRILKVYEDG